MKVKPMIGEYEVPGIQRIGTIEDRRVVEIPVPGLAGSYHQDLGSGAVSLRIEGTLAGDDARDDFLGKVREMYNAGDPVDFVADIVTATHVEKVLMTDLAVAEVAGTADTFRYAIVLAQHVEPPPPSPGADQGFGDLSDVNAAVAAEAGALAGAMNVPDLIGALPNLKDPTPPLKGTLDGVKSAVGGLSSVGGKLKELFG
jgi:hypothetical protein